MKVAIVGANGFIGRNAARWFPNSILITRKTRIDDEFFERNPVDWIIHCAAEGGSRLAKDSDTVLAKNIKSYDRYARFGIPMVYFSSGAAIWKPDSPYGLSKRIIESLDHPHVKIVRIFGSYGPYEKSTRFTSAVASGFVTIHQDRLFDFIHVHDIMSIVEHIIKNPLSLPRIVDAVYPGPPLKLSEFAELHGAKYSIENKGLGEPYIADRYTLDSMYR